MSFIRKNYELIPTLKSFDNYDYMAHSKRRDLSLKITELMDDDKKKLHSQILFLTVGVDRVIDEGVRPPEYPLQIKKLMEKCWKGREIEGKDDYEKIARDFIISLRKLHKDGFKQAEHIYSDFLLHLVGEYRDVGRKGRVLKREIGRAHV